MTIRLLLLALVCIVPSCPSNYQELTSQQGPSVPQQVQSNITELQSNRERWAARNIKNYRFVLYARCCGPVRLTSPVSIEVRDGSAISIAPVQSVRSPHLEPYERFDSVEKLFSVIEGAINRQAEFISVSYEPTLGHPVSIVVDESKTAVDDDFTFRLEQLGLIE